MQSMIPKQEIGVLDFLKSNPTYDGRGVTIAIWDTGIDPTSRGLQVTSEGKPKIIDMIDASGSGDVPMIWNFKITDSTRSFFTPTGRFVTIPSSWKPVDGLVKVGIKPAWDIFPASLIDQLKTEKVDVCWRSLLQSLCNQIHEELNVQTRLRVSCARAIHNNRETCKNEPATFNAMGGEDDKIDHLDSPSPASFFSCNDEVDKEDSLKEPTSDASRIEDIPKPAIQSSLINLAEPPNFCNFQDWLASLDKTEKSSVLMSMEKVLSMLNDNYQYATPVFDCYVFKGEDGDFVACVDTSPYEDTPKTLADLPLLKDFSIGRQHAHFGNETLLFFTVKILNDGDLLQIVTNSESHATHVASIAAAYYPTDSSNEHFQTSQLVEDGNQNGIAPGAQIVSIKIANTSLKGMETNSGLLTALNWTSKLNCDIINYSFGEKAFLPNFGRLCTHLSKFVSQTDVAFVSSGGNNGPSLGTVGSPGGSVDGLIGVAPMLSPTMMEYMYSQPTWKKQKEEANKDADCRSTNEQDKKASGPVPSIYAWGSRGPSVDGDLGLTVSACGGAIADVAAWKRTIFDLHNGSSMSSPSVAGALALVLSALRQSERQPTLRVPFILWRAAIFSCAKPISHLSHLDQGAGIFQVGETYEYLRNIIRCQPSSSPVNQLIPFQASNTQSFAPAATHIDRYYGWRLSCHVNGPGCIVENTKGLHCRGIWLRSGWLPTQVNCPTSFVQPKMSFSVDLEPVFCDAVSAEFRRNFSLNLSIQVGYRSVIDENDIKSPKRPDWLCVAPFVMLSGRSRKLPLFIDPTAFPGHQDSFSELEFNPPSKIHHTCLAFVNADSPQHEPLAYLPITIQLPTVAQLDMENGVYTFGFVGDFFFTQKVCRWFVRIPRGSTAGVLRFQRTDDDGDTPSAFTLSIVLPQSIGSALGTGEEVFNRRINLIARNAGGVGFTSRSSTPVTYESSNGEFVFAFPIDWASETVEITLAQHPGADTPDRCQIRGKLNFHGLEIRPEKLVFHLPQTYFPINLRSNFGHESIKFEMESKFWIQPLR
nr:tripeptidyl peptidase 2 [Hymenolepis microstoma]